METRNNLKNRIKRNLNINGAKKLVYVILHPVIKIYKKKKIEKMAVQAEQHYHEVIADIKKSGRTRLNFAAYVIFDSTYGMDGAFKIMMKDTEHWNPRIVVIPDVERGPEHAKDTYRKTKAYFIRHYGEGYVIDGYDPDTDTYYDHIDEFDMVYYANPYDSMAHKYHSIKYGLEKHVLPIYISYGFDIGYYTTLSRLTSPELNLVWKCFSDTTYSYEDFKRFQVIKGKNVRLVGYSKMDDLAKYKNKSSGRKRILISPHHTVSMLCLPLSNFLTYYNLILELPKLFPEVDFVFRPHPLLFTTLINNNIWSRERISEYLNCLKELGIEYSYGGDYLKVFAECDAIINDCGSFTIEWLYTGKPGCFVLNKHVKEKQLTALMKKAISTYDIARSREDIIGFVQKIADDQYKKGIGMEKWVRENIAINYPNVSQKVIDEINIFKK